MVTQFGYGSEPREIDWGIMRYVVDLVICLQYGLLLECNPCRFFNPGNLS